MSYVWAMPAPQVQFNCAGFSEDPVLLGRTESGWGNENETPTGRSFPLNINALCLGEQELPVWRFRRAHLLNCSSVKEEEACILLVASFFSL